MILNILIAICGAILITTTMMTFFIWYNSKNPILKDNLKLWCWGTLSFVAQGLFNNLELSGLLAFGITNWAVVIYFQKVFSNAMGYNLPYRNYNVLLGVGLLVSALLLILGYKYEISSAPFCLAAFGVLLHSGLSNMYCKNTSWVSNSFRALLILDGVHFLDYPIIRTNDSLAVIGFSITIMFYFACASFIPIFIFKRVSEDYTKRLESEVDLRTRQVQESHRQLNIAFEDLKQNKIKINNLLQDNRTRLSVLVHDISTPLQTVFLNLTMLMTDPKMYVEKLPQRSEKLQNAINMINDILREARTTHAGLLGKEPVSLQEVRIDLIIEELQGVFEDRLKEKNLIIETSFGGYNDRNVLGNEKWLKNQVFSNLISNAIKFSSRGGKIKIHTEVHDENKVSVFVTDNGTGIPDSKLEHIFDFEENTTTAGTAGEKGTGLGLPIVKRYVELMGGEVNVINHPNDGVTFEVQLTKVAS